MREMRAGEAGEEAAGGVGESPSASTRRVATHEGHDGHIAISIRGKKTLPVSGENRSNFFTGPPVNPGWYARVPVTVLGDDRLTAADKLVYAGLACHAWAGNSASVGTARLCALLGVSRPTVLAAMKRLSACGHLAKAPGAPGRRAVFLLASPVFAQKQGEMDQVHSGSPSGVPRLVSVKRRKPA